MHSSVCRMLRIRQTELCTVPPILLCPDVPARDNPARGLCSFHEWRLFCPARRAKPIWQNTGGSNDKETVNKDTKDKRVQPKTGAIQKYYINSEYRSLFLRQLREMRGLGGSMFNHPDLQQTRLLRDESDVQSLVDLMEDSLINPFREEQDSLVNIATGAVAPVEIANDLMNAHKVGEDAYQEFKTGRLEKDDPVNFYAPMKKQKSKTFSEMYTEKVKCKGKEIVMKADRKLFGHMVVVAQSRKLDMKEVLSHPLGPIPWAKGDGSLAKTDKSKLMSEIGKNVPVAENIAGKSTCIIDGMSVVQKLNGNNKTFRDFAISVLKMCFGKQNTVTGVRCVP